jgi:hypothetical protein
VTRGRHPLEAIKAAEKIAVKRGLVQFVERGPDRLCDLLIVSPFLLAMIRIKRMRYIRCTPQWLDRDAGEEIASLRMFPSSQEISRELWICSPKYFLRFFRVTDTGLVEIGPDSQPLPPKSPAAGSGRRCPSPPPASVPPVIPDPALVTPVGDILTPGSGES